MSLVTITGEANNRSHRDFGHTISIFRVEFYQGGATDLPCRQSITCGCVPSWGLQLLCELVLSPSSFEEIDCGC